MFMFWTNVFRGVLSGWSAGTSFSLTRSVPAPLCEEIISCGRLRFWGLKWLIVIKNFLKYRYPKETSNQGTLT